jgi:hypothetical protein
VYATTTKLAQAPITTLQQLTQENPTKSVRKRVPRVPHTLSRVSEPYAAGRLPRRGTMASHTVKIGLGCVELSPLDHPEVAPMRLCHGSSTISDWSRHVYVFPYFPWVGADGGAILLVLSPKDAQRSWYASRVYPQHHGEVTSFAAVMA